MLENSLGNSMKDAMKSGNKTLLSTVRLIISEIKNKKIDEGIKELLTDEQVVSVIKKMAKQRKESIEKFAEGGRQDLVDKESEELDILEEYLPEEMPEAEVEKVVVEVIDGMGGATMKEMGAVMKEAMSRLQGKADGKVVNKIVREKLS